MSEEHIRAEALRADALRLAIGENVRLDGNYFTVIEMAKAFYAFIKTGDAPMSEDEVKKAA